MVGDESRGNPPKKLSKDFSLLNDDNCFSLIGKELQEDKRHAAIAFFADWIETGKFQLHLPFC